MDVAHGLAKDLTEPMAGTTVPEQLSPDGDHPLWDRDEVHEIYAEWRQVFDEYDPPRTAVAEAWVHESRRARYASPRGLGQAFNFDLLEAEWDPVTFRNIIVHNLSQAAESGASSTWVLSNHDVIRHPTRYGFPPAAAGIRDSGKAWLRSGGREPVVDFDLGLRRARAASLLILALPGSTYLYQGEELGLPEVADLPDDTLQDPTFFRSAGAEKGRDGCRVPLPWTPSGPSLGFGDGPAHLPQPAGFAKLSVLEQLQRPGVHAAPVSACPSAQARTAVGRIPRVDRGGQSCGTALPATERLAVHDQFRRGPGAAAGRRRLGQRAHA